MIVITPIQLKQTNLVFLDHSRLSKENTLLKIKNDLQAEISKNLSEALQAKDEQIFNLQSINGLSEVLIADQQREIQKYKRRSRRLIIGGCVIGASLFLLGAVL